MEVGGLSSLSATAQPAMSLADILQQSRKLTNQLARDSDLPSIQLGIDQIESQSRKLVSKSVRSGHTSADARAHYLLASGGIDAAQLSNAIQHTNISNTFEPLQPVYDTDVGGYLRHEHEQVVLSMIEESRCKALEDFQRDLGHRLHGDWQVQKQHVLEELGQHRPSDDATASLRRSVATVPGAVADTSDSDLVQHGRMSRYDAVIARLNKARMDGEPVPLIHAFMDMVESFSQDAPRKRALLDAWTALKYMVREASSSASGLPAPIPAREYAAAYMDADAFRGPAGIALREKWVRGAREFLEKQFSEYMEQVILANPIQAQRGGVPSVRATVAAFLRVQLRTSEGGWPPELAQPLDAATQAPLWAMVFVLVRSGHVAEALACLQENEGALQRDATFLTFFKAWADSPTRTLTRTMRDHWMGEYVTRFRSGAVDDPYRYALYRVLGKFDVAKKFPAPLVLSTENWLWLQLCLVSETSEQDAQAPALQSYTLQDLGHKLEKYGEAHFDPKGQRPLHYFQLLLLVGRFESAIAFLQSRAALHVDAVHFAIALTYYGLLRVPPASAVSQFEYLTNVDDLTCFDFGKLLQRYARRLAPTSRRDALAYLSLLCLNADCPPPMGAEQVQRCHELVQSLILASPSSGFVELLGDVRADGLTTPGLIEQQSALLHLDNRHAFLSKIVHAAAVQCEREQRTTDAILLYNYGHERDTVMAVLNRALGATLMEPGHLPDWDGAVDDSAAPLSVSSNPVRLARAILASYAQQGYHSPRMDVCESLLQLKRAATLYHESQWQPALQALEALHILPLDAESRRDVVSITRKAEDFKTYDETITMNFSDIALMAMNTLYQLHEAIKKAPTRDNSTVLADTLPYDVGGHATLPHEQ
ncbi:nuclear pore complex subunit [Malassezia nana]|uniref:Nuclear pore protein n=1 Tax=Malassezia nana TaxID=180528 RepID=A0AAF0J1B1_9BASI|nr:nuclear pore complex subunit [Malassezia nana]